MKARWRERSFSAHLKWALYAIIAVLVLPDVVLFVGRHWGQDDRLSSVQGLYGVYYREVTTALETIPEDAPVAFPGCLRRWGRPSDRDRLFADFTSVADLRKAAPDTILCRSRDRFARRHLVSLLNGSIVLTNRVE